MSAVVITFAAPIRLQPLTALRGEVTAQVVRYLQRELPDVDAAQYDATTGVGAAYAGDAPVAAFEVAPIGGAR